MPFWFCKWISFRSFSIQSASPSTSSISFFIFHLLLLLLLLLPSPSFCHRLILHKYEILIHKLSDSVSAGGKVNHNTGISPLCGIIWAHMSWASTDLFEYITLITIFCKIAEIIIYFRFLIRFPFFFLFFIFNFNNRVRRFVCLNLLFFFSISLKWAISRLSLIASRFDLFWNRFTVTLHLTSSPPNRRKYRM